MLSVKNPYKKKILAMFSSEIVKCLEEKILRGNDT